MPITADKMIRARPSALEKLRSAPTDMSRYTTTSAKPPKVDPHANSAK